MILMVAVGLDNGLITMLIIRSQNHREGADTQLRGGIMHPTA